mgnify:CR=1 FL=1
MFNFSNISKIYGVKSYLVWVGYFFLYNRIFAKPLSKDRLSKKRDLFNTFGELLYTFTIHEICLGSFTTIIKPQCLLFHGCFLPKCWNETIYISSETLLIALFTSISSFVNLSVISWNKCDHNYWFLFKLSLITKLQFIEKTTGQWSETPGEEKQSYTKTGTFFFFSVRL